MKKNDQVVHSGCCSGRKMILNKDSDNQSSLLLIHMRKSVNLLINLHTLEENLYYFK